MNNSRPVTSSQVEPHSGLLAVLAKHLQCRYQRPIPQVAQDSFAEVENWLAQNNRPVIMDSGCGVGRSTRYLAERYPEHVVIGIDQSVHRLSKAQLDSLPGNMLLIRANLVDFWRLAAGSRWQLNKHYLLYPNPWPKTEHLKRRWHGHPVFPDLLALGGQLELRTNWEIYALEMQQALEYSGHSVVVNCFEPGNYLTPFEEKYHRSGQRLFKLTASLT